MHPSQTTLEAIRVMELEGRSILECAQRLKSPETARGFEQTVEWCQQALEQRGKIVVTGVGKSGKIGQKIAATLSSTGSLAVFLHPTEGLHGDLGLIQSGDVVLALSNTGNTEEVVRLVPILKNRGAKVVAVTGNRSSRLARDSDAWIDAWVSSEACPHNLAPTCSTTLALALGDALAVTLMKVRGFDAKAFAQNHPGGSLGKRLHLKVQDLAIPLEKVASVGPATEIDEVIELATRLHHGAVLVVEGSKLLGIITDGDIRRSLRQREGFFLLKAQDIMTRSPVLAKADMMAQDALELMENRSSQISVLPVVEKEDRVVGLLRLHDLVQSF
ncbi:MAG: KpsF/GutQ family sugar-phosphate isomerase [Bdellovibrio sp.]|nr:KpsF/GutQ family sugar-phosphate isomerase [Bdellovibrio sp.]